MPPDPIIHILVVGHAATPGKVEAALAECQVENYVCVEDFEAAGILIGDGFDPDLVIAVSPAYCDGSQAQDWQSKSPCAKILQMPVGNGRGRNLAAAIKDELDCIFAEKSARRQLRMTPAGLLHNTGSVASAALSL